MKNLRLYLTFVFILLIAAFAIYIDIPAGSKIDLQKLKINYNQKFTPHLGLDLQGGVELQYQGDLSNIAQSERGAAMDAVQSALERRVFNFGVQEPLVETTGTNGIIVELPGVTDINQAIQVIGQTPFLEFRTQNPNPTTTKDSSGQLTATADSLWTPTGLTGKDLSSATVNFDPTSGAPEITLQFDAAGTTAFAKITQANIGKPVAIFLDGSPLSTPTVQSAITNGQAVITGQFTVQEAKRLGYQFKCRCTPSTN